MESRKGVEALDVSALADPADAGPGAGEVVGVNLFDRLFAHLLLCGAHAPGGLDACDRLVEARAGDPEARRHVPAALVLYDARKAERAPASYPERSGGAVELTQDGVEVCGGFNHQLWAFGFLYDGGIPPQSETLASEGLPFSILFLIAPNYFGTM